ncbi:hypothetical protein D3C71_1196840 [compost metagenome]
MHALGDGQPQRGPVAADDLQVALGAAGDFEPRVQALFLGARGALVLDPDPPARGAVPHPREQVDDRARAVIAGQARRPARLVAVHVAEQLAVAAAMQLHLDFAGVLLGQLGGPLGGQAGMDHHPAQVAVDMQQFLQAQPLQQFVAVLGLHDAQQIRVDLALLFLGACTYRQQAQVMVAQHHHAALAQRMDQAQRFQRLATAVDQVAAEPQFVHRRVEADLFQQPLGDVVAALQVADGPDTHARASISAVCVERSARTARSVRRTRCHRRPPCRNAPASCRVRFPA